MVGHTHKLEFDMVCIGCIREKYAEYDHLLTFVRSLAKDIGCSHTFEAEELLIELGLHNET